MSPRSLLLLAISLFAFCQQSRAAILSIDSVAALISDNTAANNDQALVAGYSASGDGGGGTFVFSSSQTAAPDGGMVVNRTAGGQWFRVTSTIDVRMFGAKGDGITNDRASIQAAIDAAQSGGYTAVHFWGKKYRIAASRYDSGAGRYFDETGAEAPLTEGIVQSPFQRGILKIGFHARKNVSSINTTNERLTIQGHGLGSGELIVISSTDSVPTVSGSALFPGLPYYAGIIDANTIVLYRDAGLTQLVDFTGSGTGAFRVESNSGPKIDLTLLGEGSILFTDDEAGARTVTDNGLNGPITGDAGPPNIFLVKTNLANLVIKDFTLDRVVTGGRAAAAGNYQAVNGSANPGDLTGSQLFWTDRPNGFNRAGIFLMPSGLNDVPSVSIKNVVFNECHPAVATSGTPGANIRDYFGKLKELTIDNCRFVYPFGANTALGTGSGTGTNFTPWVGSARVTDCDFDGAVGSVADTDSKLAVDGFVFGDPERLVCTGNKVRHCGVEFIYHFAPGLVYVLNGVRSFVMPPVTVPPASPGGNTINVDLGAGESLYPWVTVGTELFVGYGYYDPVGGRISAGYMKVEAIEDVSGGFRNRIKFSNLGGPFNASPGETVTLTNTALYEPNLAERSSSLIANNEVDCSPVPGAGGGPQTAYGGPAIRVNDVNTLIEGNKILNAYFGIHLEGSKKSENSMWGSTVSNNFVEVVDVQKPITNINTSSDQLTVASHIWYNGGWARISSNGTLPTVSGTALDTTTLYVIKKVDGNTVSLYRDTGLTAKVDFQNSGTGTIVLSDYYGSTGIFTRAKGVVIEGNSIVLRNANHSTGIEIGNQYCSALNNTISAISRDPNGLDGTGVWGSSGATFCTVDGNITRNMQTAVNSGFVGSVFSHYSFDDGQGVSSRFSLTAGTEALPGFSFTDDGDTGIYLAGPNQIGFAANGEERMLIGNSGVTIDGGLQVNGHIKSLQLCFSANKGGVSQTITANTWTLVTWSTENLDVGGCFASNRWTPNISGVAELSGAVSLQNTTAGEHLLAAVVKNGSEFLAVTDVVAVSTGAGTNQTATIPTVYANANGTTDYFEFWVNRSSGTTINGAPGWNFFNGKLH